jgi:hypothetical protein
MGKRNQVPIFKKFSFLTFVEKSEDLDTLGLYLAQKQYGITTYHLLFSSTGLSTKFSISE